MFNTWNSRILTWWSWTRSQKLISSRNFTESWPPNRVKQWTTRIDTPSFKKTFGIFNLGWNYLLNTYNLHILTCWTRIWYEKLISSYNFTKNLPPNTVKQRKTKFATSLSGGTFRLLKFGCNYLSNALNWRIFRWCTRICDHKLILFRNFT